jgi:aarF domain-containing kinase
LDELYRQIMSEFDYRREANSLDVVRSNMKNSPFRRSVRVPKPLLGLCSKELLVMELLDGTKLSDSLEKELEDILGTGRAKNLLDRKRLELVLGEDKLNALESVGANDSKSSSEKSLLAECGWTTKLKLLGLYRRAQSAIDMLVDVQGYQMLKDGVFQGDPHPGNILDLRKQKSGGKIANFCRMGPSSSLLGLIDYGQTKHFTDEERLGIARVILALGEDHGDGKSSSQTKTERVANAMRDLGFATKFDDSEILEKYAGLFFDSDDDGKRLYNCPTPQTYYKILTKLDPLVSVPDAAIFAARCGFLLRGMGSILGKQIRTSKRWSIYAKQALEEAETTTAIIG